MLIKGRWAGRIGRLPGKIMPEKWIYTKEIERETALFSLRKIHI
jgi:hypothetical protein